jgi:hypothetical protein
MPLAKFDICFEERKCWIESGCNSSVCNGMLELRKVTSI